MPIASGSDGRWPHHSLRGTQRKRQDLESLHVSEHRPNSIANNRPQKNQQESTVSEAKTPHRLSIIAAFCLAFGAHAADDDLLSRDALFGDDPTKASVAPRETGPGPQRLHSIFEAARTSASPEHWSKSEPVPNWVVQANWVKV